jgi:hypothetical protein
MSTVSEPSTGHPRKSRLWLMPFSRVDVALFIARLQSSFSQ